MLDTLIVAATKGSGSRDKDDNEDSDEDDNGENDTDEKKEEEEDDYPDPKMKLSPITADWDWLEVIEHSVSANQKPPMLLIWPIRGCECLRGGVMVAWHDTINYWSLCDNKFYNGHFSSVGASSHQPPLSPVLFIQACHGTLRLLPLFRPILADWPELWSIYLG